MNTINTIKVWGTTYTLGNYPAEVMTTIQGETAMLDKIGRASCRERV